MRSAALRGALQDQAFLKAVKVGTRVCMVSAGKVETYGYVLGKTDAKMEVLASDVSTSYTQTRIFVPHQG